MSDYLTRLVSKLYEFMLSDEFNIGGFDERLNAIILRTEKEGLEELDIFNDSILIGFVKEFIISENDEQRGSAFSKIVDYVSNLADIRV